MEEKNKFSVGDIEPVYQVVGFNVVKRIENEQPVTVFAEKQSEAELLSFIFKQK